VATFLLAVVCHNEKYYKSDYTLIFLQLGIVSDHHGGNVQTQIGFLTRLNLNALLFSKHSSPKNYFFKILPLILPSYNQIAINLKLVIPWIQ
jgi:hypothetical protein